MGRGCSHYKRCFLRKARAKSLTADVVVANHSLVFAEMIENSPALPPHAHVVFDEAHNLEESATRHFSVEMSVPRVRFALRRLWAPARRGRRKRNKTDSALSGGTGLLAAALHQLQSGAFPGEPRLLEVAVKAGNDVCEAIIKVEPAMAVFFNALAALLDGSTRRETRLLDATCKATQEWERMAPARLDFGVALAEVIRPAERLAETMKEMDSGDLPFLLGSANDLEAVVMTLKEIMVDVDFVLAAERDDTVYWVERASPARGGALAWGAPIHVGEKLATELYALKESIVFSSATLTVRGSFSFLKGRLGVDRIESDRLMELSVGTPFDYLRQCAVMVPTFLPDPGDGAGDYSGSLAELLSGLFARTRGRSLVLFTSYTMLREVAEALRQRAGCNGLQILVQGDSGSREQITSIFKRDRHSVLLGTHSFWEGVDVVGDTLSCLVVARLPFAVFTDPIVDARCRRIEDTGQSAFTGYSLPGAVIRLRQGFGRLIRHRSDRGIVIVADKRMITRRYGGWFQRSLPAPARAVPNQELLLDGVSEFLAEV